MALDVSIKCCNLRYWRQKAGYTQKELAKLAGISDSRISEYEREERYMTFITAAKIAYLCQCSIDDLYEIEIRRR